MSDELKWLEWSRETGRQDPEQVLHWGRKVVRSLRGEKSYAVLEQIAIAAIECRDTETANYCLSRLDRRFDANKSLRLRHLHGLQAEADGKWKEAEDIYEKILAECPLRPASVKRLACVAEAKSELVKAISILTDYLDHCYDDVEAWRQCSIWFLRLGHRDQAIFASEEVLLLEPKNLYNVLFHAELIYHEGDVLADTVLAYKLFLYCAEQGLEILRVFMGILQCTRKLRENGEGTRKNERIERIAIEKIQSLRGSGNQGQVVTHWLSAGK